MKQKLKSIARLTKEIRILEKLAIISFTAAFVLLGWLIANSISSKRAVGATPRNTLELIRQNTVRIIGEDAAGNPTMGSGAYLGNRWLLTARHVCEFFEGRRVRIEDYLKEAHEVESYAVSDDPTIDLCLLKLKDYPKMSGFKIASRNTEVMGARNIMAGYPGGYDYTVLSGVVYMERQVLVFGGEERGFLTLNLQFSTTPGAPGISGGPSTDLQGRLIGIVVVVSTIDSGFVSLANILDFLAKANL